MLQDYSLYRFVIKEFSNRFLRQFSNIIHAYILPKSNNTKGAFFTRRESNLISFTLMHLAELRKKKVGIYMRILSAYDTAGLSEVVFQVQVESTFELCLPQYYFLKSLPN